MIIDGKAIAAKRLYALRGKILGLSDKPKLVAVLVGNDVSSEMYVKMKAKRTVEVGMGSEVVSLPTNTSKSELIERIQSLNQDDSVTGILVQLPLPERISEQIPEILQTIDPKKDVDGLTGKSKFLPATVKAVITIIQAVSGQGLAESLKNKNVTVVGQGRLVGKPLSDYLESQGVKVNRCDEFTSDLKTQTLNGDVLVVATGVENLITADMVKNGAIVIDCGAPKAEVDFEKVKDIASAITPVPGGVGPITVVSLLENTLQAYGQTVPR